MEYLISLSHRYSISIKNLFVGFFLAVVIVCMVTFVYATGIGAGGLMKATANSTFLAGVGFLFALQLKE